jgi:quinol monooxygenase YgiN
MTGFIQIVEYTTSRPEQVKLLTERFRDERRDSEAGPTVVRGTVTADRDRPGVYLSILEFPSYEVAMANSARPETTDFARAMAELCDGPPRFYNLDVQEVFTSEQSQAAVRA